MKQYDAHYPASFFYVSPIAASLLAGVACVVVRALILTGDASLFVALSLVVMIAIIIILGLKVSPLI